jgi:putative transposase
MYDWRNMSDSDRSAVLKERKAYRRPWHSPPHFDYQGDQRFIITAACFEHKHVIGKSAERMEECEAALIDICNELNAKLYAWCLLPNHYHLLISTDLIKDFLKRLGKYHGSSSYTWNGEDEMRGRKVWYRSVERSMRSERHYYATLNCINHNPVKHGYVDSWKGWPYSIAGKYLETVGRDVAANVWRKYPILDYGKDWDVD